MYNSFTLAHLNEEKHTRIDMDKIISLINVRDTLILRIMNSTCMTSETKFTPNLKWSVEYMSWHEAPTIMNI